MPRKVTWIERRELYLRGARCCAIAHVDTWEIEIDTAMHKSAVSLLDSHIHELFHLKHPDWPERKVKSDAKFIARELRRLGYRLDK